jgi:hypothetical protein
VEARLRSTSVVRQTTMAIAMPSATTAERVRTRSARSASTAASKAVASCVCGRKLMVATGS